MNLRNRLTQVATNALASLMLGCLGAWLFMHIHLPPETLKIHEPGFLNILAGKGAAPDQYRLLQNHLIGLLYRVTDLYHAVFWFTAASLATSIFLLIEKAFPSMPIPRKNGMAIMLALIYPVLMYNGPRGDSAFILVLALGMTIAIEQGRKSLFLTMLALMTFARADIALFAALFALLWKPRWFVRESWALVVALPLLVQGMLQFIIFPDARYYCDVIMLKENLKLERFWNTPAFMLIAGGLLLASKRLVGWLRWLFMLGSRGQLLLLLFAGYVGAIFTVAIAAEVRLFLPMAPFLLLLIEEQAVSASNRPESSSG